MDASRSSTLSGALDHALRQSTDAELRSLANLDPTDERDELLALALIHDLHLAPWAQVGTRARWQHHPAVAQRKQQSEETFLASLDASVDTFSSPLDARGAVRRLAARDRVAPIYDWVALEASREELVDFLALEGGPDDGFDDLVATCQIGLVDGPKMEMARNYWDEMGGGEDRQVHRSLHRDLSSALGLPHIPRADLPLEALRRMLLTSTLATNRSLQPELVGVLGMIELQAGPRCRQVVRGLERLGLPAAATPFYAVHAATDPRHGRDWLDHVIAPLSDDKPFSDGIVRGARWRSAVDRAFFSALWAKFAQTPEPQAA